MGADARSAAMFAMMSMPAGRTLRLLYPRLMRVDDLTPNVSSDPCGMTANAIINMLEDILRRLIRALGGL